MGGSHQSATPGMGVIGAVVAIFAFVAVLLTLELSYDAPRWVSGLTSITLGAFFGTSSVPMSGANIKRFFERMGFTMFMLGMLTYTGIFSLVVGVFS